MERWLDHRPQTNSSKFLELQTIFQPNMPRRKSVSKLTDPKDVTDPHTNKYCLTTQEQDSEGELETKLYKVKSDSYFYVKKFVLLNL